MAGFITLFSAVLMFVTVEEKKNNVGEDKVMAVWCMAYSPSSLENVSFLDPITTTLVCYRNYFPNKSIVLQEGFNFESSCFLLSFGTFRDQFFLF